MWMARDSPATLSRGWQLIVSITGQTSALVTHAPFCGQTGVDKSAECPRGWARFGVCRWYPTILWLASSATVALHVRNLPSTITFRREALKVRDLITVCGVLYGRTRARRQPARGYRRPS